MKIEIEINSCKECPFVKHEQIFTCDGRPDGFVKVCSKGTWRGKVPSNIHDKCQFRK